MPPMLWLILRELEILGFEYSGKRIDLIKFLCQRRGLNSHNSITKNNSMITVRCKL